MKIFKLNFSQLFYVPFTGTLEVKASSEKTAIKKANKFLDDKKSYSKDVKLNSIYEPVYQMDGACELKEERFLDGQ